MRTTFRLDLTRSYIYLSWGALITVIETFFVIAPIMANYVGMALIMLIAVGCSFLYWVRHFKARIHLNVLTASVLCFHLFVSGQALATGTSRSYTDLFFYWSGIFIMCVASSFHVKNAESEKVVTDLLIYYGLFFAVGVILQMLFTDAFLKYLFPLFGSDFQSSLNRQVVYHQMYTGWTTQTFATCINLMMGLYAGAVSWERAKEKKYLIYILVMLAAFLLTGKRGPLVFLLLAYFAVSIISSDSLRKAIIKIWKYVLAVLCAAVVLIIYVQQHSDMGRNTIVRFMEIADGGNDDVSNGRFELWSFALKLFLSNPITGVGWRKYHEYALSQLNEDIEAHNVYLQLLAETGILGFLLYVITTVSGLIFTFLLLKKAMKYKNGECVRLLKFSLMVQVYLFLYANTGNTLYDYCAQLCYYFVFSLCLYVRNHINTFSIERISR